MEPKHNLTEAGRLGSLLEKFTDENINLSVKPVMEEVTEKDGAKKMVERLPGLDNHTMGTIFEELLRKFNEDIIENDLLEAIIAMPEKDFYNTGISTYIWIITNRKEERRKGYVQLIDASNICTPLRKNLGEKNCETAEDDRKRFLQLLIDFKETLESKIFKNEEFGYWQVPVMRPKRDDLQACSAPHA